MERFRQSALATREREVSPEQLVCAHELLARKIAGTFYKPYVGGLEFDDVLSYAKIGLVSAANRFDPSRGLKFSTFASPRIVGAILDGFRQEYRRTVRHDEAPPTFEIFEEAAFGVEVDFDQNGKIEKLLEGVAKVLDARERRAVVDKLAGVLVRETATALGVTKSYVWQLEKRAVERLRRYLEGVPERELTTPPVMGRKRKCPIGNAVEPN